MGWGRLGLGSGLARRSFCLLLLLFSLGGLSLTGGLGLAAIRRSPQSQVVAKQLHDKRAITVRLLREGVELGDRIVKCLLCEMASTVGGVENFVVED